MLGFASAVPDVHWAIGDEEKTPVEKFRLQALYQASQTIMIQVL